MRTVTGLGKFLVLKPNGTHAETTGASSTYHDTYESAATDARERTSRDQQYAVAQIVSVFSQELQTVEHRITPAEKMAAE